VARANNWRAVLGGFPIELLQLFNHWRTTYMLLFDAGSDPEMQRLMALTEEANARAKLATATAESAMAEAQKQLKLWEQAALARGLDPDLYSTLPPWRFHLAERYWPDAMVGPGTVKTQLNIVEDHGPEDGLYVKLEMSWSGESEQPQCWKIQWTHYLSFLANELESYLYAYAPVPGELMETLLGSLPPELREPFEQKGNYGQV
jgi:hypothetical protein